MTPRSGLERWAALGGVLYVVLFVVGTIFAVGNEPAGDASPTDVMRWYAKSGHRDRIHIGWVLVGLGIFFFLWFLAALRAALYVCAAAPVVALALALALPSSTAGRRLQVEPVVP